jgi:hypothetical protein
MKKWFRFSYLSSKSDNDNERTLLDIFGEVVVDRFLYLEDTAVSKDLTWKYLESLPGFIKKSGSDYLTKVPFKNDPRIIFFTE